MKNIKTTQSEEEEVKWEIFFLRILNEIKGKIHLNKVVVGFSHPNLPLDSFLFVGREELRFIFNTIEIWFFFGL